MCHRDDGIEDGDGRDIGFEVADEGAVDLEFVDQEARQVGQAGVTGPEVVYDDGRRTRLGSRSRQGRGTPFKMTTAKLRLTSAAMGQPGTKVGDLYEELGVTRQRLSKGELRPDGVKLLSR